MGRPLRALTLALVIVMTPRVLLAQRTPTPNKWGPFRGQVVDAETDKPIAGAVFVAVWIRMIPFPIHAGEKFNDARVAVADGGGRFEIPRRDPPWFAGAIENVYLACVAPGYAPYQGGGVEPQASPLRLRPLNAKERRNAEVASFASNIGLIPHDTLLEFEKSINSKRLQMGLMPIRLAAGGV